ncbi:MAG TPA: protein kinase, partial [Ktedonobacteraceae bacterium]
MQEEKIWQRLAQRVRRVCSERRFGEMPMKLWRYGQSVEYLGRRYRLDGMLGSGGMADVCLAWDEREQREVALKILKSDDLDQETLNRFMKEAAQIAHWQHPHILRVYETLQVELIEAVSGSVLFYMVSEYARGGDLQKRLLTGRPFPLSASFALFRQLCDAVQYAHEHGVIHRDLKPLNVLFRRPANGPEEVVLSDFGLAVQVEASHHTFAHGGTLAYMAPEQFQGHALPASDIFALGVVIYLLCTGGLPFRRSLQDMTRIVQGRTPIPTRPSLHNPELPPNLDEVILRALRELPAERYRQPRDFWEAIEQVLTTNARTFPFVEEYGQNAGQTWPYDSSEQLSRRSRQAGQQRQFSSTSAEFPDRDAPELEEGPISALWIAREKQKASPVHLPLPTHSIPSSPNPSAAAAPDEASLAEDAPEQYVDAEDALERDAYTTDMPEQFDFPAPPGSAVWQPAAPGERDPWERPARAQPPVPGANAGNSARPHAPRSKAERQVRESRLPGSAPFEVRPAPDTPAPRQRPAASSSGSTILPAPRQVGDDLEQTSRRRQPFAFGTDPQTSRRQPTRQFSDQLDSQSRGQPPLESSAYDVFTAFAQPEEPAARSNTPARPARRAPVSRRAMPDTPAMPARAAPEASVAPHPQRAPAASSAAYSPPYRAPARRAPARVMARSPRAVGRHRLPLVIVLGGLLLLGLLCAIFAATGFQGAMLNFFGAPIVRVTLQPASHSVQQDTTLHIRTDGGQLAADEIPGRQLTSTSPTQSATANATGSTQGKQAT